MNTVAELAELAAKRWGLVPLKLLKLRPRPFLDWRFAANKA
jgi:hypothetical protein